MANELLSIKEASEILKVSSKSIVDYISSNTISAIKSGKTWFVINDSMWRTLVENTQSQHKHDFNIPPTSLDSSPQNGQVMYSIPAKEIISVQESDSSLLVEREIEQEERKKKIGFNELTPSEWALLSKNVINEDEILNSVWKDLSSPRNKYQLEHGAVYPVKLAERLIKIYSATGDTIFDPFLGIGTSIIAAHQLKRHAIGIELNSKFATIADRWLNDVQGIFKNDFHYKIVNDDCRNLKNHIRPEKIQLTITSPPYADFIQKSLKDRETVHKTSIIKHENNSTVKQYSENNLDFGNLPYSDFLKQIKIILKANWDVTKWGGYSAWVVKDYRDTKNKIPYVPFHSDLAQAGEEVGWKYHDLIIWDQTGQRRLVVLGYPSVFYTNQNCSFIVIFRKNK